MLARRSVLQDVGGFDPALQPLADWDLWLRVLHVSAPACVAEPLVAYRVHGTNMSLDTRRVEADFAVVAGRNPRANRAVLYRYLGWWSIRVGRHADAARLFLRGAAERDARYPVDLARQDLIYLARQAADRARVLLRPGRPARRPPVAAVVEHADWRRRGQDWLDRLPAA